MTAVQLLGGAGAAITGALAAIHVYWALGGRFGMGQAAPTAEGRPLFRPGRLATAAVAAALAVLAWLYLWAAELAHGPLPLSWAATALALAGVILVARAVGEFRYLGFFKRVTASRFARLDTFFYSPLCLVLGLGGWVVSAKAFG